MVYDNRQNCIYSLTDIRFLAQASHREAWAVYPGFQISIVEKRPAQFRTLRCQRLHRIRCISGHARVTLEGTAEKIRRIVLTPLRPQTRVKHLFTGSLDPFLSEDDLDQHIDFLVEVDERTALLDGRASPRN